MTRLATGSAAAAAGLREGDELLNLAAIEAAEDAGTGAMLQLSIRRGEETLAIAYSPWGPQVTGMQWVRTEAPEAACGI